jgi:hypothetical protein
MAGTLQPRGGAVTELTIHGADRLEKVAKALKDGGHKELKKQLLRGFREAGKPVIREIRASALEKLPRGGGLAALVAGSQIGVRTRLGGNTVGVQIRGTNRSLQGLRRLDRGELRHPVFGNREVWVGQGGSVTPGWFSKPIESSEGRIRSHMASVLNEVAAKVERSS